MKKSVLIEDDNNDEIESVHFIYLTKITNTPIIDFYFLNNNNCILINRNNNNFSFLSLIVFNKNIDESYSDEDINDEKDNFIIKNINSFVTHKMDELNKKSVKLKNK